MVNNLQGLFTEQGDSCVHTCAQALVFCLATSQDHTNISVDDFAVSNCSTLRGLFFLPVMGIPPHCISFKRNYYKADLLQIRECTQVPTIYTNVFAVSFVYTTFMVKDFTITARSGNGSLLYSPGQCRHSFRLLMRLRCFFAQIERLRRANAFPLRLGNR